MKSRAKCNLGSVSAETTPLVVLKSLLLKSKRIHPSNALNSNKLLNSGRGSLEEKLKGDTVAIHDQSMLCACFQNDQSLSYFKCQYLFSTVTGHFHDYESKVPNKLTYKVLKRSS